MDIHQKQQSQNSNLKIQYWKNKLSQKSDQPTGLKKQVRNKKCNQSKINLNHLADQLKHKDGKKSKQKIVVSKPFKKELEKLENVLHVHCKKKQQNTTKSNLQNKSKVELKKKNDKISKSNNCSNISQLLFEFSKKFQKYSRYESLKDQSLENERIKIKRPKQNSKSRQRLNKSKEIGNKKYEQSSSSRDKLVSKFIVDKSDTKRLNQTVNLINQKAPKQSLKKQKIKPKLKKAEVQKSDKNEETVRRLFEEQHSEEEKKDEEEIEGEMSVNHQTNSMMVYEIASEQKSESNESHDGKEEVIEPQQMFYTPKREDEITVEYKLKGSSSKTINIDTMLRDQEEKWLKLKKDLEMLKSKENKVEVLESIIKEVSHNHQDLINLELIETKPFLSQQHKPLDNLNKLTNSNQREANYSLKSKFYQQAPLQVISLMRRKSKEEVHKEIQLLSLQINKRQLQKDMCFLQKNQLKKTQQILKEPSRIISQNEPEEKMKDESIKNLQIVIDQNLEFQKKQIKQKDEEIIQSPQFERSNFLKQEHKRNAPSFEVIESSNQHFQIFQACYDNEIHNQMRFSEQQEEHIRSDQQKLYFEESNQIAIKINKRYEKTSKTSAEFSLDQTTLDGILDQLCLQFLFELKQRQKNLMCDFWNASAIHVVQQNLNLQENQNADWYLEANNKLEHSPEEQQIPQTHLNQTYIFTTIDKLVQYFFIPDPMCSFDMYLRLKLPLGANSKLFLKCMRMLNNNNYQDGDTGEQAYEAELQNEEIQNYQEMISLQEFCQFEGQLMKSINQYEYFFNRAIYDCINIMLDQLRPFGKKGRPPISFETNFKSYTLSDVSAKFHKRFAEIEKIKLGFLNFDESLPAIVVENIVNTSLNLFKKEVVQEIQEQYEEKSEDIFQICYDLMSILEEEILNEEIILLFEFWERKECTI